MNFCTKCASYYAKPGTCNCFAEPNTGASPWQYPVFPTTPAPTVVPSVWPPTTTAEPSITITVDGNDVRHGDEGIQWTPTGQAPA